MKNYAKAKCIVPDRDVCDNFFLVQCPVTYNSTSPFADGSCSAACVFYAAADFKPSYISVQLHQPRPPSLLQHSHWQSVLDDICLR